MTLQSAEWVSVGIEDVDPGIIESHDDILGRQMKAGDNAAILRNVSRGISTSRSPGRIDEISLFEVRLVGSRLGASSGVAGRASVECERGR